VGKGVPEISSGANQEAPLQTGIAEIARSRTHLVMANMAMMLLLKVLSTLLSCLSAMIHTHISLYLEGPTACSADDKRNQNPKSPLTSISARSLHMICLEALLTKMSNRPYASMCFLIACSQFFSSMRSKARVWHFRPSLSIASLVDWALGVSTES
jgi:hypothetical protein